MVDNVILASELDNTFEIDGEAEKIKIKIDSTSIKKAANGTLSAVPTAIEFDSVNGIIKVTNPDGTTPPPIDLSQFLQDLQVTGGSFDAATSVLKLVDNDNENVDDITIDLSTLLGVSTDEQNLLSNGADGKPKLLAEDLDDVIGDRVQAIAGTNVSSVFGTPIVRGFAVNT